MFESKQRYISRELTHFVGTSLRNSVPNHEAEQYKLLIKIVKSGLLTHAPTSRLKMGLIISDDLNASSNVMYSPTMVCFCDIPVDDLSIHIGKYSRFGLSFSKDFIANLGGTPIYYILGQPKSLT